jgi:hypothetical protein
VLAGAAQPRPVVAELERRGEQLRAVRSGPWKYIDDRQFGQRWLYRLDTDPGETKNVRHTETAVASSLAQDLQNWEQASRAAQEAPTTAIGEQRARELKALGYAE